MNLLAQFGLEEPRTILIVEDHVSFAVSLSNFLQTKGHTVFTYAGVDSILEGVLLGLNPLTADSPPSVNLNEVNFCFLDHYFEGLLNGSTVTSALVQLGVTVCGMSSMADANQAMQRRGALFAFQKEALGSMLSIRT